MTTLPATLPFTFGVESGTPSFAVGRARARPPLELHAEIDTADGFARYRWDANARDAGDRPQGIQFGSTLMNGHANGGCTLARHISRGYPDLGLYDTLRFVGVDGRVAYEGRGSRFPREASTVHRISAEAVGWMAHARDKPILFLGVDQDMASWGQTGADRQAALQTGGYAYKGPGTVMADKTLSQSFEGAWPAGELPLCEALFDAGPRQNIGKLYYASTPGLNVSEAVPDWIWSPNIAPNTLLTGAVSPGNLNGAPANTGLYTVASPAGMRYAAVTFYYGAGPAGVADMQFNVDWAALQVIGDHGLTLQGTGPYGLLGSDIIKYTASLAAPLLDTSNVLATQHAIDQFVFRDLADVYDMWLVANQYERWNLAVWDDRKLHYHPLSDVSQLQTADWVLRSDHRNGLARGYDGPTVDGQANGAIVRFQNILTGAAEMIDPTTNPELADTNTRLAANRAGLQVWEPIQLPNPNSPAGAAKIGAAALAELNRQRTPGRFTIKGHLQDSASNWHQGWVPRAGDTVVLPEDEDDAHPIRVIHEVTWNHDGRTLTINADAAARTLDAIIADMT